MGGEYTLGIWDGHDAGAALVRSGSLLFAINEERLTRRKLEIGFPERSIRAALEWEGIRPNDIRAVVASTSDFAKTLSRCIPHLREEYYLLRRRLIDPGVTYRLKKFLKYKITEIPPLPLTATVSKRCLALRLAKLGFSAQQIHLIPHHTAHAAAAAFCSPFSDCAVLTLDGVGDGLSGTIWSMRDRKLSFVSSIAAKASLGIFYEHVTNLLNLRELEDEGKVMALATYSLKVPDEENPLLDYFNIDGLALASRYSSTQMHRELARIHWRHPPEQFAYMAQRTIELYITTLAKNILRATNQSKLAYAGGVASNVKANMLVRELPDINGLYVFPQMGDGGTAAGAALWYECANDGRNAQPLNDVLLGPSFSDQQIRTAIAVKPSLHIHPSADITEEVAILLSQGEIVPWFQGRMEYGPRSLGARSILARADLPDVRDSLNLKLKRRSWYQPFCPSILESDAPDLLTGNLAYPDRFMTSAYNIRTESQPLLSAVMGIDGTCRPQIVPEAQRNPMARLLQEYKLRTGHGVLLNTSFNLHGEPLVCSPEDAVLAFQAIPLHYMAIGRYLVSKDWK